MINLEDILNLKLGPNDAGATTIREYLVLILANVWFEGEGFSGKRPFGNSGWQYDLINVVETEFGNVDAHGLIQAAIESLAY
jgi:hypothetical protein